MQYEYILIAAALFIIILVYFKVADRFNIIDKPNERSSHVTPTIRGGGVIFPLSILLLACINYLYFPLLTIAVLLSGVVSFIDDVRDMPRWLRFGVHIIAASLILYEANVMLMAPVIAVLAFVFVVGVINAYNFMDGINGITGFYSIAVLVPLMYTETDRYTFQLQSVVLIAVLVFLFFNARTKARCFAGDVGSVTIAVIISFLICERIIIEQDYKYLAFLSLYIVDTSSTFIQRAKMGEKVFEAHRRHLFQVLSNEMKQPHLLVAAVYGTIQLAINWALIQADVSIPVLVAVFVLLYTIYILLKVRILKKQT